MRTKRLLISLVFLIAVWCMFLFGRFFLNEKPIKNLAHIPENALFAMRLDGSSALKSTLFSILLEANDPEVIDVINAQINKKWKGKGKSKALGIDFLSDIVVYIFPFEGEQMLGISYNLNRPDLMRKNAKNALQAKQFFAINGDIGVILTYLGKEKLPVETRNKAIALAKEIAFKPVPSDLSAKIAQKETDKFVQLSTTGMLYGSSTLFSRADMDLSLEEHAISMSGDLIKNQRKKGIFDNSNYTLAPNGMHFYTTLIPDKIQDSLRDIFAAYHLNLPRLKAVALNYRGLRISNPDGILIGTPDLDLVLNFNTPIDLYAALKNSKLLGALKWHFKDKTTLSNGIKDYFISQIDEQTYALSSIKNAQVIRNTGTHLLRIEGDLSRITNVSGDKWIMLFLNNFPLYYNSKSFLSKTDRISITVEDLAGVSAKLDGKIKFKESYFPMNEVFKYAVQNNLIRLK